MTTSDGVLRVRGRNYTEKTHSGDGSLTISEMQRREDAWQDAQPLTVRCGFCPWTFDGTVAEGKEAFAAHTAEAHPRVAKFRGRQKKAVDAEAAWRAARAEEDAQRAALDAMDAGEPQPFSSPPSNEEPKPEAAAEPESATARRLREAEEARLAGLEKEEAVGNLAVSSAAPDLQGELERASSSSNPYGLKRLGRGYVWPREIALQAIRAFAAEHGHPPATSDLTVAPVGTLPSAPVLGRLFGSFPDAIVAAGFERPTKATIYRPYKHSSRTPATATSAPETPSAHVERDEQESEAALPAAPAPPSSHEQPSPIVEFLGRQERQVLVGLRDATAAQMWQLSRELGWIDEAIAARDAA